MTTASSELPIKEMIEKKEDMKQVNLIEPPRTSSEPSSFTITPRIGLTYHYFLQNFASPVYDPQLYRAIATNYDELLSSFRGTFRETLSTYFTIVELDTLTRLYAFRRPSEIIEFLINNPFLLQFLQDAHEQIRNYFDKSAHLILELTTDPEVTEDQQLVIFIRTTLSPNEAIKHLDQLDERWWLDVPINMRKKLCIDVESE